MENGKGKMENGKPLTLKESNSINRGCNPWRKGKGNSKTGAGSKEKKNEGERGEKRRKEQERSAINYGILLN